MHSHPRAGVCRWSVVAAGVGATMLAAAVPACAAETVIVALAPDLTTVLTNIRNLIMGLLALLATVILTIGGVRYVLAAGDPGEIEAAKRALKAAAFGFALAALAPVVVAVLRQIVEL